MAVESLHFSSEAPTISVPADDPLTRLVRRLEAATSRLEDIASSSGSIEQQANGSISAASGAGMPTSSSMPDLPKGGSREASTNTVIRSAHEKDDEPDVDAPPLEVLPERIKEMDQLIEEEVKEYVDASKGLDTLVEEQVSRMCEE
jgi:adenylyl cyclase-associated protein